jgi:hypothetical protein
MEAMIYEVYGKIIVGRWRELEVRPEQANSLEKIQENTKATAMQDAHIELTIDGKRL